MFRFTYWLVLSFLMLFSIRASSQTGLTRPARSLDSLLMNRVDIVGNQASLVTAVITPQIEVFAVGWNTARSKDLEVGVGKLFSVSKQWLVGGYVVNWPDSNKSFLLPWINYHSQYHCARISIDLAYYIPLNHGPSIFFSNEASVIWPVNKAMQMGVVASFSQFNSGTVPIRLGPTLRWQIGNVSIRFNFQPDFLSFNGRAPDKLRLQIGIRF